MQDRTAFHLDKAKDIGFHFADDAAGVFDRRRLDEIAPPFNRSDPILAPLRHDLASGVKPPPRFLEKEGAASTRRSKLAKDLEHPLFVGLAIVRLRNQTLQFRHMSLDHARLVGIVAISSHVPG